MPGENLVNSWQTLGEPLVNPLEITKNRNYLVEALGTSGRITCTKVSTELIKIFAYLL